MDAREMLELAGIPHGEYYGRLGSRNTRYLPDRMVVQIGEDDSTFDRWANSVDMEFDIGSGRGRRAFVRAAAAIGRDM